MWGAPYPEILIILILSSGSVDLDGSGSSDGTLQNRQRSETQKWGYLNRRSVQQPGVYHQTNHTQPELTDRLPVRKAESGR